MPATFYGGVFGSSRVGGTAGDDGITEARVRSLIASSQLNQGAYDTETTYSKFQAVDLEHGFGVSRVDANLGNDPLTDNGSNWILLMNGVRSMTWWCRNQTEELPTGELGANQTVTSDGVVGFTGTSGGDDSDNGGISGVTTLNITAVPNADPTAALDHSALSLPAGEYQIDAQFYGNQTPDQDLHMRMMEAMADTDDIRRLVGTTRQSNYFGTGDNNVHAHYVIQSEIKISSASFFYFQLVNYGSDKNRIVGFVKIRRII